MEIKNSKFCDKCQLRLTMHVVTKIMTIFVFKIFIQTCHSRTTQKKGQWEHYVTFCNSMLETVLSMACSWSLSGVSRLSYHLSLSFSLFLSLSFSLSLSHSLSLNRSCCKEASVCRFWVVLTNEVMFYILFQSPTVAAAVVAVAVAVVIVVKKWNKWEKYFDFDVEYVSFFFSSK